MGGGKIEDRKIKFRVYYCDDMDYMINPKPPTIQEFLKHWHELPFDVEASSLEEVYEILNTFHGLSWEEYNQLRRFAKKVHHTSMSAGDIVEIDDCFYLCDTEGWRRITW